MRLKRLMTGALSVAMLGTMMCSTAFAAEYADGDYTGEIHFLNANGTGNNSMCDPIFVHEAELTLDADSAELTFYVAYPIPNFSSEGADGTVKDVAFTVDGTKYEAVSDITTKPEKVFDTTSVLFGVTAGETYPTQVLTVDLPRDVVDDLEAGTVSASAYVNVAMNSTQNFFVKVSDLQPVGGGESSEPAKEEKNMQITADVAEAASAPSYTVTVPESVAIGTLKTNEDNTQSYEVKVAASDLDGSLSISAPETGELTSDGHKLAFTNSFGTQTVSAGNAGNGFKGEITISKDAVAAAAAGNYIGTATFTIAYTAN